MFASLPMQIVLGQIGQEKLITMFIHPYSNYIRTIKYFYNNNNTNKIFKTIWIAHKISRGNLIAHICVHTMLSFIIYFVNHSSKSRTRLYVPLKKKCYENLMEVFH